MTDLIERLESKATDCHVSEEALYREAVVRIRELEDLLNRQKARTEEEAELRGNALNDIDTKDDRIRELEAELDIYRDLAGEQQTKFARLYLEKCNAIEAATIERCKQAVRECPAIDEDGYIVTKSNVLSEISRSATKEGDDNVGHGEEIQKG